MSFMDVLADAGMSAAKGAAAGSVVPGVGTAVGGLIGLASSLVPHIFGADATPILAAAAQAITGATDETTQVQILSTDSAALAAYKVQALKIAADREQAQLDAQSNDITARLADVQDARATTVNLSKTGTPIAWGAPVISLVTVVGFFAAFGVLAFVKLPADAGIQAMLNQMVGILGAGFTGTLGYWIGSSAGSASKDVRIANMRPDTVSAAAISAPVPDASK